MKQRAGKQPSVVSRKWDVVASFSAILIAHESTIPFWKVSWLLQGFKKKQTFYCISSGFWYPCSAWIWDSGYPFPPPQSWGHQKRHRKTFSSTQLSSSTLEFYCSPSHWLHSLQQAKPPKNEFPRASSQATSHRSCQRTAAAREWKGTRVVGLGARVSRQT